MLTVHSVYPIRQGSPKEKIKYCINKDYMGMGDFEKQMAGGEWM